MSAFASVILEQLCSRVFRESRLVYFITDKTGNILEWGGNLSELNLGNPRTNTPISDIVIFMEGILPLENGSMEFSCIQMTPQVTVDALVFQSGPGYGLILWDASQKEAFFTETQQKCNELSLLIEKQKSLLRRESHTRVMGKNTPFMEDLFRALNFAVLEMNDQDEFILLGSPPQWIDKLPHSDLLVSGRPCPEDVFSFLGNFIQEAKSRWLKNPQESFKSGLWIEKDHTGQEFLFEATAVVIHGKRMLIIANDVCDPIEKQTIIQKGRDLALHYHSLKRNGKKLKDLHHELELRVKERTRDLEQANLRLANELKQRKRAERERREVAKQLRQSQKMEAIGTLAGGIAHDFNNILGAIIGFSELSLAQAPDPIKPKLEQILNASERAKNLVRQILTFSHQTEYEKRPLQLSMIVKEALKLLRATIPAFIDFKTDLQSDAYILADQTQMHQVMMNLCTNAWHAMKEEGGTLTVCLRDTTLSEGDTSAMPELSPGQHLLLVVGDTGCGIRKDMLERIFDPYFTTKGKDKGTGLGLSVVHGIITKTGGHISVESKPGQGTEFKVLFPCFDSDDNAAPAYQSFEPGNNELILFVDDESYQTEMIEQIMEQLGYRVILCNDSLEALDIFLSGEHDFDLVITDMLMPKMTGKSLAEKILTADPAMPVILCSGYHDEMDPDTMKKIGIKKILMKPFGMNLLSREIRIALGK
ncbi:hybrid sensor histidine kinase/response regulator [Desulfospira joergensenii]|uniref:hybrid sensor histidine kinase/response regulator n=1 Tax=Desulfospira joergensenii TaxID=53329 RepID=UPI000429D56C|nr:ATP-binding protein [Desulfospira joergensenii]